MTTTKGGKWHAFITSTREVRVAEYAAPQPWGQATREEALRLFRPSVQSMAKAKRREADAMDAALNVIDAMLEES